MGRWGDEVDEELQQDRDIKPRFMISFKSMMNAMDNISESLRDYDDKHPRDNFRMIWLGAMLMLFIFFCFSYNILMIATIPFIAFYAAVLIKLFGSFKQFGYSRKWYWPVTILAIIVLIAAAIMVQRLTGLSK